MSNEKSTDVFEDAGRSRGVDNSQDVSSDEIVLNIDELERVVGGLRRYNYSLPER
ncbi:hypothetical protein NX784_18430 [Massilia pinisoli]|uniref:Bacteriocin n=1 Tax=Massilia pinisoli TaxID=1772194 RepID=A0ABT1ZUF0_9BURK|nr:hypothetical protein [Massilia pinisoli]MCS0583572.1 hypothetical protein [Massilia pinisoli]